MYYQSALNKTVSYVELNLCVSFTLDQLIGVNGFSQWHFSRLFHLFTGYSISEYIRGRRLTEAAKNLIDGDDRIIDIAVQYQFSSQDAFTRAFSKAYGISPGRYRKKGQHKVLIDPLDISKIIWTQGGLEMKAEIKIVENLTVMGMVYEGKNQNGEIDDLFEELFKRKSEINGAVDDVRTYGICEPLKESIEGVDIDKSNDIKYLAGIEVKSDSQIPEGMEVWSIPHKRYAVFTHLGSVELLGDTYKAIYSMWLPESGYEVVFTYDFEVYDHRFKPGDPQSKMYIYIPIK